MTATTAPRGYIARDLVAAVEDVWSAIRDRHADVPDVVVTIGGGSAEIARGNLKLGHFWPGKWQSGEDRLPELFVGGEGLRRDAVDVLGTLLHEAAHGVANTRGVDDTSRQGRYHNKRYKQVAEELGLLITQDGNRGWSGTAVPPSTAETYRQELARLAEALTAYRHADTPAAGTKNKSNNNGDALWCGCTPPRRVRVSPSVAELGPIICGVCEEEFAPVAEDDEED
jgi:hypothetical protein